MTGRGSSPPGDGDGPVHGGDQHVEWVAALECHPERRSDRPDERAHSGGCRHGVEAFGVGIVQYGGEPALQLPLQVQRPRSQAGLGHDERCLFQAHLGGRLGVGHLPVDDPPGRARERFVRIGEDWPDTLTVRTPSGDLHLYFRVPGDCTIATVSGGRTALGPGIDVRGPGRRSGGYLIGPGSVVDGTRSVITGDVPILELPDGIANRITIVPV